MGLIQHHDAISGTERQHVADDYVQRVSEGVEAAMVNNDKEKFDQVLFESPWFQVVLNNAYAKLLPLQNQSLPNSTHFFCQLLNISECLPIEKQDHVLKKHPSNDFHADSLRQFTMTIWNPTIHLVITFVRVPVTDDYTIIDLTGHTILSDVSMNEVE